MNIRTLVFGLVLFPAAAWAQTAASDHIQERKPINAATRAVLLVNCPERFTSKQWLEMMEKPVNQSLYPLRITQAALDTIDARELDPRYRYELVRDE